MALTNKRIAFIEHYLICWNASEAARLAGYKHPGTEGHRLLQIAEIQAYIKARLEQACMSADEVLIRLAEKARFDIGQFVYQRGDKLFIDWGLLEGEKKTHLVKAVYQTQYGSRVEFHDSERALELIGKHHKLFTERHEVDATHTVSDDVLDAIGGALKRGYDDGGEKDDAED